MVAWHGMTRLRLAAVGGAVALAVTGVVPGALGAAAGTAAAGTGTAAAGTGPATQGFTIHRSSFGVPTITGTSQARMWFGVGWAQAQDRMVQLELTRRAVEGTLSAIFGPGELSQDETVRTFFYTPAELKAQFASLPAATRTALVAYSAGINAYEARAYASAATRRADVPYEFFALGKLLGENGPYRPARWQPVDTVAVGNYLARQFGGGGGSELTNFQFLNYMATELQGKGVENPVAAAAKIFNDARWLNDPTAPTTVPAASGAPARSISASAGVASVERTIAQLSDRK